MVDASRTRTPSSGIGSGCTGAALVPTVIADTVSMILVVSSSFPMPSRTRSLPVPAETTRLDAGPVIGLHPGIDRPTPLGPDVVLVLSDHHAFPGGIGLHCHHRLAPDAPMVDPLPSS